MTHKFRSCILKSYSFTRQICHCYGLRTVFSDLKDKLGSRIDDSGTKSFKSNMSTGNPKLVVPILSSWFPNLATKLADAFSSASFVKIDEEDTDRLLDVLQDAEIIIGDPKRLAHLVFKLPKLRWVQTMSAGVDLYMQHLPRDQPHPSFVLTKLGGVFGAGMSEYVLGQIIAWERKFTLTWQAQKDKNWSRSFDLKYRCLSELTIGIIGVGEIGRAVAKLCKATGMTVNGIHREVSASKLPFIDNSFTLDNLSECLKQCDYFCNALPSTPATRGLFSGRVLEACKERKTVFINVGRGDVIDEKSLLKALDNQWIGGAILDVFEVEPLPTNSPLWSHPRVTITPHISPYDWKLWKVDTVLENFLAYQSGKPMKYVVDWTKGY